MKTKLKDDSGNVVEKSKSLSFEYKKGGDTVEFTSTNPYRIRFAGRTRQYINVFGEELIVDNADRALLAACNETGAVVGEYTVAPCYMSLRERGAHEWILEFEREPDSREHFAEALDRELRAVNGCVPGARTRCRGWSTTAVWPTRYWRSAGKRSDGVCCCGVMP